MKSDRLRAAADRLEAIAGGVCDCGQTWNEYWPAPTAALLRAVAENEWACQSCRTWIDNGAGDLCPEHAAAYALADAVLGGTE